MSIEFVFNLKSLVPPHQSCWSEISKVPSYYGTFIYLYLPLLYKCTHSSDCYSLMFIGIATTDFWYQSHFQFGNISPSGRWLPMQPGGWRRHCCINHCQTSLGKVRSTLIKSEMFSAGLFGDEPSAVHFQFTENHLYNKGQGLGLCDWQQITASALLSTVKLWMCIIAITTSIHERRACCTTEELLRV